MSTFRYSRWDGSQQLPAFDADDVLDALSDDILAEGDVRRALQRLMQRGLRGTRGGDVPGLRRIMERLRARRQEELERSHLDGVLEDLTRRSPGTSPPRVPRMPRCMSRCSARRTSPSARMSSLSASSTSSASKAGSCWLPSHLE